MELFKGNVEIKDLVIRRSINKSYSSPSNPQLIYSKRLEKMGRIVNPGDRVEFVFVETSQSLQGYKMYPPEVVVAEDLPIDYLYYLNNHIKNPIDQLLELAGIRRFISRFLQASETLEN
jgi:DNA polymerase elongation subunit (family B)